MLKIKSIIILLILLLSTNYSQQQTIEYGSTYGDDAAKVFGGADFNAAIVWDFGATTVYLERLEIMLDEIESNVAWRVTDASSGTPSFTTLGTLSGTFNSLEDAFTTVTINNGTPITGKVAFMVDIAITNNIYIDEDVTDSDGDWMYFSGSWQHMTDFGSNSVYAIRAIVNTVDPTPVELTEFTASMEDGQVFLKWKTATEVNNYGFEIERASTPLSPPDSPEETTGWEKIGFVLGHGNSNSPKKYSFVDANPFGENPPGGLLEYRLKQIDTDGTFEYYTITTEINYAITSVNDNEIPKNYELNQNYPNPFNPSTNITYSIIENTNVKITIYNSDGKVINELINEHKSPGNYSVTWNGKNAKDNDVASGVYFYRLIAGNSDISKKMILLR